MSRERRWFSSDSAKRNFGTLSELIREGLEVDLLGREDAPLLMLVDANLVEPTFQKVTISVEEAKAEWSSITAAATFFGTEFRIQGKHLSAVLRRHEINRHPAFKFKRPQMDNPSEILEEIKTELSATNSRLSCLFTALEQLN